MISFLKASLRTATSIFLALFGLAVVIGVFVWAKDVYDREQAKPFEDVREWAFDLRDQLGIETKARTKLVGNVLLVSVEVVGYPKYLANPRNANGSLIFQFIDKDGFKVISKPVLISEFATIVGKDGEKSGLGIQFDQFMALEEYQRFSGMKVSWNLVNEPPPEPEAPRQFLDHCAPEITKAERLKRLEQYGKVRQNGGGRYSASNHSVVFFYDGSLIDCQ